MFILYIHEAGDEQSFLEIKAASQDKDKLIEMREEILRESKEYNKKVEKHKKLIERLKNRFWKKNILKFSFNEEMFPGRDKSFYQDKLKRTIDFLKYNFNWLFIYKDFVGTVTDNATMYGIMITEKLDLSEFPKFTEKAPSKYLYEHEVIIEEVKEI